MNIFADPDIWKWLGGISILVNAVLLAWHLLYRRMLARSRHEVSCLKMARTIHAEGALLHAQIYGATQSDRVESLTLDVQTSEAKIASQHSEINRLEEQLAACEGKLHEGRQQRCALEEENQRLQTGNEKLLLASSADGLRIKDLERDLENVVGMYAQARTNIINLNGTLDEVREKAYVRDGSRFYRLIPIRSDAKPVLEKKARKKEK